MLEVHQRTLGQFAKESVSFQFWWRLIDLPPCAGGPAASPGMEVPQRKGLRSLFFCGLGPPVPLLARSFHEIPSGGILLTLPRRHFFSTLI